MGYIYKLIRKLFSNSALIEVISRHTYIGDFICTNCFILRK